MRRYSFFGCMIAVYCFVVPALGEQQVKLQSGATLVGEVTMNGANLVVDVNGAKLEVPFKDVAAVTPVASEGTGGGSKAQQLLVQGLESKALNAGGREHITLLAEAYRLAPEDPRVAFWYARSLLDAGFGKGASEVFDPHRKAIAAAYPGVGDQLASEIDARVTMETMPAALVKRVDELAAAAKSANRNSSESVWYAAYFRMLDQTDQPIGPTAIRVSVHGHDQNLESFGDGYYLFTYRCEPPFLHKDCRLEIVPENLSSETTEFSATGGGVANAGVIRVKRLDDVDRRPVVVKVSDPAGKPLAEATVSFGVLSRSGYQESGSPVATKADGTAELNLFPNKHRCQVSLEGYAPISQDVVVPAGAKRPVAINLTMHRAISAKIKGVWRSTSMERPGFGPANDNAVTTGHFELGIGAGGLGADPRTGVHWVRLVQKGDQLRLQVGPHVAFGTSEPAWVGRWRSDAKARNDEEVSQASDADVFEMIDLAALKDLKSELRLEMTSLRDTAPVDLPLESGDIFLGKLGAHNPQFHGPAFVEFKILAVEVVRP